MRGGGGGVVVIAGSIVVVVIVDDDDNRNMHSITFTIVALFQVAGKQRWGPSFQLSGPRSAHMDANLLKVRTSSNYLTCSIYEIDFTS